VGNVYGNTGGVNGPWAVWVSDDGRTWERLADLELAQDQVCTEAVERAIEASDSEFDCPIAVTAGDAGWVISTWVKSTEHHQSVWASADGRTWEPLSVPGVSTEEFWGDLPQVALGSDAIVVNGSDGESSAVGTIAP
jgi:hypothetical protein